MPSTKSTRRAGSSAEAEAFDPYLQWLNIPTTRRPPTHYDLLGLPMLEGDTEVIRQAAFERLAHVRKYQISQHGERALRLLDELSQAYVCLTDPALKTQYDAPFQSLREATREDWSESAEKGWGVVESTYPGDGDAPPTDERRSTPAQPQIETLASPLSRLLGLAGVFRTLALASGALGLIVVLVLIARGEQPLIWLAALVPVVLTLASLFALAALLETTADTHRRLERRLDRLEDLLDEQQAD